MRRFGAGLAALALGAALSGCWLQPGFDAGNTNANTGEATITAANVDLLDEQWSAEVGDAPVESLLALGSRVFTGGGVAGVPSVFGLQAATGAPLWTATPETDPSLPPPTASDPVHVDGHLEVAWSLGAFGGRTTIDPATGQELSNTGGPGRGGTHTLAVVDGETAAGVRAQHQAFPGQVLTAVDWRCDARSIDPLGGPTGGSTFAFVGDALAWSHGTRALGYRDCDPGSATWATTWATELGGTPTGVTAVGTGAVAYVDDTGTLSVLDAATGAIRWTTEVGPGASRATVAGGRILVATPDARLVAYAADTGSPVWQATLPAAGGRPVVGGDVAAVAVGTDVLAFPLDGCGAATCPPEGGRCRAVRRAALPAADDVVELVRRGEQDHQPAQQGGEDEAAGAHGPTRLTARPRRPATRAHRATVRGTMTVLASYRTRLDGLVAEAAGELGVPGAVCGVLIDGEMHIAHHGVANVTTGAPVLPTTLFQLGSITKVYTATLVMQAVQAGLIALDEPVRAQLQEFMVADPGATIEITPRHLLTHTSGIEGDHLVDTGWNDDALARYVATLAGLGQLHPTDEAYSFCNTGYGVLGRLLEVATGDDFDRALRRRLTRPLGSRATVTLPKHALLHSVAVGHRHTVGEPPTRQPRWTLTRANGPMGGVLAPAGEVLALAAMHLDDGRAADGVDLLAPVAVEAMQRLHADTPIPGESQALGWTVRPWGELTSLGLDADTFGQRAALRLVPERGFAACVMANSPRGGVLAQHVLGRLAADLLDVEAPDPGDPVGDGADVTPAELSALAGSYDRLHQRVTVTVEGGRMRVTTEPSGILRALGVTTAVLDAEPTGRDGRSALTAVGTDPTTGQREVVVVVPATATLPASLYLGGRLHRRVA